MRTSVLLAVVMGLAGCGDNLPGPTPIDDDDPPTAAPAVEILSPTADSVLDVPAVSVRVRVRAEAGLASARLTAGDVTKALEAVLDAQGEATVELTLPEGAAELTLDAIDQEQRAAHASVAVRVDSEGPALTIAAPRADAAETRRLLFARLHDDSGIASIEYRVNDGEAVHVPVEGAPTDATVREALPFVAGANTVALTVTDGRGHARTQTVQLRYGLVTSGGGSHSGAVVDGELFTWGRYNQGQLGLGGAVGDAESRLSPAAVPAFGAEGTQVASIAFNQNQSLAIRSDGTLWSWGANGNGQLGQGDLVQRNVPAQVPELEHVVYAHLGFAHAIALRDDGAVFAWGKNNAGQIGVVGTAGSTDNQLLPTKVEGIAAPVVKIAGGSEHSLALTVDGRVYAWGRNQYGNLGVGSADLERHPTAIAVPGLEDVVDIATGRDHVIALRADGSVVSWGLGASGQLGYGVAVEDEEDRSSPVAVTADAAGAPLGHVRAVFANGNTSYAIVEVDGAQQYWGWGQNFSGQLATGATSAEEWFARRAVVYTAGDAPTFLDETVELSSIGTGATHTIARTKTGQIYAWGWNFRGSLGVPAITNAWAQTIAVEVALPTP